MSDRLFSEILRAVEQQLVSPETPYVQETLVRLVGAGVAESEAKNWIAECLIKEIERLLATDTPFDGVRYRADLLALAGERNGATER